MLTLTHLMLINAQHQLEKNRYWQIKLALISKFNERIAEESIISMVIWVSYQERIVKTGFLRII